MTSESESEVTGNEWSQWKIRVNIVSRAENYRILRVLFQGDSEEVLLYEGKRNVDTLNSNNGDFYFFRHLKASKYLPLFKCRWIWLIDDIHGIFHFFPNWKRETILTILWILNTGVSSALEVPINDALNTKIWLEKMKDSSFAIPLFHQLWGQLQNQKVHFRVWVHRSQFHCWCCWIFGLRSQQYWASSKKLWRNSPQGKGQELVTPPPLALALSFLKIN